VNRKETPAHVLYYYFRILHDENAGVSLKAVAELQNSVEKIMVKIIRKKFPDLPFLIIEDFIDKYLHKIEKAMKNKTLAFDPKSGEWGKYYNYFKTTVIHSWSSYLEEEKKKYQLQIDSLDDNEKLDIEKLENLNKKFSIPQLDYYEAFIEEMKKFLNFTPAELVGMFWTMLKNIVRGIHSVVDECREIYKFSMPAVARKQKSRAEKKLKEFWKTVEEEWKEFFLAEEELSEVVEECLIALYLCSEEMQEIAKEELDKLEFESAKLCWEKIKKLFCHKKVVT